MEGALILTGEGGTTHVSVNWLVVSIFILNLHFVFACQTIDVVVYTRALEATGPINREHTVSFLSDDWCRVACIAGGLHIQIFAIIPLVLFRDYASSEVVRCTLVESCYPLTGLGPALFRDHVVERIML